jgi:hypothetical protein
LPGALGPPSAIVTTPSTIAEVSMLLYLLVVGAKTPTTIRQLPAAA